MKNKEGEKNKDGEKINKINCFENVGISKNLKAAVLFSGGKDSCLALLKAKEKGFKIKYLLTILPSSYDSYMFHKPSLVLLKTQAKALKLPLIIEKSKSVKEKELNDLERLLKKVIGKVDLIVSGGVASEYQYNRIKKIVEKFNFKLFCPLWQESAEKIWDECLKNNFKIILTKICCEGIAKEWLGKEIDEEKLKKLKELSKKHGFSLEFEGGDAETAVLFMPLFSNKIEIKSKIKTENNYRHFLLIKKAKLKS